MFPLLVGLAGILWLAALGGKEALRQPAEKEALVPPPKPGESAGAGGTGGSGAGGTGGAGGGGTKSSLFGFDETPPFDPTAVFASGWGLGDATKWSLPEVLNASRAAPSAGLPEGAHVTPNYDPALAPIESGERVTFEVEQTVGGSTKKLGVLEGIYSGPSKNLSYEGATVTVDRTAESGELELSAGKYAIPASKQNYEQSYLSRVVWRAVTPESVGMGAIVAPPLVAGDQLTLVCKDAFGNTVVWIGQVAADGPATTGSYNVSMQKAYKVLKDVGAGKISRPFFASQAVVALPFGWLADPKTIP